MIRVLIADDHDILRAGLKHILSEAGDIIVAGEASNGTEVLEQLHTGQWDAAVLDLNMPGRNGIELIKRVKDEFPHLPILILSMYKEDIYAVRALKAGASGYLCKDNAESLLADAIRKSPAAGFSSTRMLPKASPATCSRATGSSCPTNALPIAITRYSSCSYRALASPKSPGGSS